MKRLWVIFLIAALSNCNQKDLTAMVIDDTTKAVGNISSDTVYNGKIKFLDTRTNKLLREYTYYNDTLHGPCTEYYNTGYRAAEFSFEHGKQNGYVNIFDRSGKLVLQRYFYHDLLCGPTTVYNNGLVSKYTFYSLDNNSLIKLDYNELKLNSITSKVDNFFFYFERDYSQFKNGEYVSTGVHYLIYTPDPPNYQFQYSLVKIDSNYNVLSVLREFKIHPWEIFTLPNGSKNESSLIALRLTLKDPVKGEGVMFKVLQLR